MFAILSVITELTMKGTSPTELFQSDQGSRAPWFLFWLLVGIAVLAVVVAWWMKRDEADETPSVPSAASGDTPAAEPVAAQAVAPTIEKEATEEPAVDEAPSVEAEPEASEAPEPEAETPAAEEATEAAAPVEEAPAEEPAKDEDSGAETSAEETPAEEASEEAEVPAEPEAPAEPDDLTKMEGIGPKISGVLQEKGISTYSQLAKTSVEELKQIMTDAKIRISHPDTWPEQAAFAAAGDWDDLEKFQDELHGGRRKG